MAKLVSRNQQIVSGVSSPASGYSRIVSCVCNPKPGVDPDFAFTSVVGEIVWLLGIKIFFMPFDIDPNLGTDFRILTGSTSPVSAADIYDWDDVLLLLYRGTSDVTWAHYHGVTEMSWVMNKLYTGQGRRFGIWARLMGLAVVDMIHVSFLIAEG